MPKIIPAVWAIDAYGLGNECPSSRVKCKSAINAP